MTRWFRRRLGKLLIILLVGVPVLCLLAWCSVYARDLTQPDPDLTPGVSRSLSLEEICTTKWGRDRRLVTAAMKKQVFKNYDLKGNGDASQGCRKDKSGRRYEVDHDYPRCAGGADEVGNLWPQCYSGKWSAVMKDRLEVKVCKLICDNYPEPGTLTPDEALEKFRDWHAGFIEYFGDPYPDEETSQ